MTKRKKGTRIWSDNGTSVEAKGLEHAINLGKNANSPDIMFTAANLDQKVKREIEIRRGHFLSDFLEEKRSKLGAKNFQKQLSKLKKEGEKAYEQQQTKIRTLREEDERKRRERMRKDARIRAEGAIWEDPTLEFLEKRLFSSLAEREKTLQRYEELTKPVQKIFQKRFYRLILKHLDQLEGRRNWR